MRRVAQKGRAVAGKIYLMGHDGELHALEERPYPQEERLQMLLADYPDLLAGEQMDEIAPRRWLLVSREQGVPLEEDGGRQMSLDHLFLDQDAIPTLVEVKRSADARIRREVVGQMLDYASHAVAYWSVEQLRARFERTCDERSEDPAALVSQLIESDGEPEAVDEFWAQVQTNLQAGRIRLLFVADEFGPALRRVVEFLNRYMDPVEVLAVEVKQYVGQGLSTLVPRVLGQTAQAQAKKTRSAPRAKPWDEASFLATLADDQGPEAVRVAESTLAWAEDHADRCSWGKGVTAGSYTVVVESASQRYHLFSIWTNGYIQINLAYIKNKPLFASNESRLAILAQLNDIDGIELDDEAIDKMPNVPLSALYDPADLELFLAVFDQMIAQIRQS